MAGFDYVAVDAVGRTVSGALTAADETAARGQLSRRGLMALELTPARVGSRGERPLQGGAGVRLGAKTLALTTGSWRR